jgi:acyl carrier protein
MNTTLQLRVQQQLQSLLPQLEADPSPALHLQNDLGLDSLGVVEVVVHLERYFDVELPTAEIVGWNTLADVYASLEQHVVGRALAWIRLCRGVLS